MRPSIPILFAALTLAATAAELRKPDHVLPLWNGDVPGAVEGATPGADDGTSRWWNVGLPGMWVYLPEGPAPEGGRIALVACPGGGYSHLTRLAGADGAVEAFLPRNVAVIALKYRTAPPSEDVEKDALADARRAIRIIRSRADEWGIDPEKVGMVGWSAGANLCLNAAVRPVSEEKGENPDPIGKIDPRPDFVVMLSPWPHKRTAADYPVPKDASPAFIASAEDDRTAPTEFARGVAEGYRRAGVPHRLWVLETGGHGAFTINAPGEGGKWIDRFWPWLGELAALQEAPRKPDN